MVYNKHVSPPMIDVDAEHVKNYVQIHVGSYSAREDPEAGAGDFSVKPSTAGARSEAPAEGQKRDDVEEAQPGRAAFHAHSNEHQSGALRT